MSIWEMQEIFQDEWVVLDRQMRVIDRGASLRDLRIRHAAQDGKCTYFFVTAQPRLAGR